MRRPALLVGFALLTVGCLAGPASQEHPVMTSPTAPVPSPSPSAADLVEANTLFAFDMLATLAAASPGENLVISPFSISVALQMLFGGAGGTTADAMRSTLHLEGIDATLDADARALLQDLSEVDPNVTLDIGNALWIERRFESQMMPDFAPRIRDSYQGDVMLRDFASPTTVDDMNKWASEKTRGKIPKVIERISSDEVLFLMNAVYFKGSWASSFNATCTHDAPFTRGDGSVIDVPMMCGGKQATFAHSGGATVVRLPYGDGQVAFYAVLPDAGMTLDAFVAGWHGAGLGNVMDPNVVVELPRFKLKTSELDLRGPLTTLGMGVAFTDQADLTRIAPSLYVSRVQHDAIMEVDENGTVAAAVTTVGVGVTSLPPPPERVVFDRPFALVIRDDDSGTLLFMGLVHDPTTP